MPGAGAPGSFGPAVSAVTPGSPRAGGRGPRMRYRAREGKPERSAPHPARDLVGGEEVGPGGKRAGNRTVSDDPGRGPTPGTLLVPSPAGR